VSFSTAVLRPLTLGIAEHPLTRRIVTGSRPGRAVASRFVAGESLEEAMSIASSLDRRRITSMLDFLGENVRTGAQAETARAAYLHALSAIGGAPDLDCAISLKLTQLGLDVSVDVCLANVVPIVEEAARTATVVMIDMESVGYVESTLHVFREAHTRYPKVGVALQSYLRRTERDLHALPEGSRIRLVKGAYLEPPEVVYPTKREVDASYARSFTTLLARGHAIDVATHDPRLLEGVRRRVDGAGEGWSRVEFQMLYGVRRDLQTRFAGQGYPVRVYVPYGTEWYPYLTRRLAERPANAWFFLSNLLRIR
jgi:proline dehydrogenase